MDRFMVIYAKDRMMVIVSRNSTPGLVVEQASKYLVILFNVGISLNLANMCRGNSYPPFSGMLPWLGVFHELVDGAVQLPDDETTFGL